MSDPVSSKFDISRHIRFFGEGDISASQFLEKTTELFVKKSDRGSIGSFAGRAKAAAIVGATLVGRGPATGGSIFMIRAPNAHNSIVPGNTGVSDKGQVDPARIEALINSVDVNRDGIITKAEMYARVAHDNPSVGSRTANELAWKAVFDATSAAYNQVTPKGEEFMTYDQVRELYNGQLFFDIAKQNGY